MKNRSSRSVLGGGADTFLAGAGEMGALLRSIDWQQTPLGPLLDWPQSLRTTMSICLNSRFPIAVYWGPDFLMLYNESLLPMVGFRKHPQALGQPARIVLAEIWGIIEPLLQHVRTTGEATWSEDLMLPLARTGAPEESYFTFTYSPVRDETSEVGGVFCAVVETTDKVIEERRLRLLNALASGGRMGTAVEACVHAASELAKSSKDIPFSLLYLLDDAGAATLAGAANLLPGSPLAPHVMRSGDSPWLREGGIGDFQNVPLIDGPAGARGAVVMPIALSGDGAPLGLIVLGLSPLLSQTASYNRFHTLLAASISQNVTNAVAVAEERKRLEALAQLDRAKTAFFSNISHEFRTPLTLLLGPAEDALADKDALSVQERDRWSLVHGNARRLLKLVNALLEFSRIEAGRVEASFEPTNLSAVTADLASMFGSAVDRGGLSLELDLPSIDEPAYVDREMWEKVVFNLLSNALKFTFSGSIWVSVRLVERGFDLVVRDSGTGIAPADLPHMFDRFHRIRGAHARSHEGTGIGLALVAELVKLHGGDIDVQSSEGHGTTFTVHIPRGHSHLPPEQIRTSKGSPSTSAIAAPYLEEAQHWHEPIATPASHSQGLTETGATADRARILVADDNSDMRGYITRLLSERWDVEAVSDGRAALAAIGRHRPDLVLADVMMPELDGFGLLQEIRRNPSSSLIPVILLSARAGEEATAEGLRAGANEYIVKPFSARELLVRVASALAVATASREAQAIEKAARLRLYGHFMQAPFPIAVLRGPNHVIELVNSHALRAWSKDERIVGQPVVTGIPELQGQPFLNYLDTVYRTGVAYEARGERAQLVRSPDGTLEDVYWDFVYAPLHAPDGTIDGVLVSGFDVTAQIRASQELSRLLTRAEAGESQLRQLVENIPDLAWTARPDGFIDYYNQGWYDYTGTSADDMQGWGWTSVHDPSRLDAVLERWRHSIGTGEPFEMEFPLRGADGVFRWFLTRVKPLHDADGRLVRWFGSNTNIDERRRNDDFRETFLAVLGHDLRNPLNTVLMTSRVLTLLPDTPAPIRKKLERVTASGVRMQRMIEQLLDLTRARLTDGIPVTLSAEEVDLRTLVATMVDEVRGAHPNCWIEFEADGAIPARIDGDRFEQVVSNLLGNAIAHGDTSRPIRVDLKAGAGHASVTVHNHGVPIPSDFLPLLFSPFARDQTTRRPSAGLGLGLYISERIVAAHGGTLSVQSSETNGTRFEVQLPRRAR